MLAFSLLSLCLGFTAATVVFAVLHALLLDPLPFEEPNRLLRVAGSFQGRELGISWADYLDWRDAVDSFERSTFFNGSWLANVDFDGETETVAAVLATPSFFSVLGVSPRLGRTFRPADDDADAPLVATISHSLWQRRFGGDPGVLGRALSIGADRFFVIGVMPAGFDYPNGTDLWTVATRWFDATKRSRRIDHVLARLAPGATMRSAASEMRAVAARLSAEHPESNDGVGICLTPEREIWVAELRLPLLLLATGGALFLFAALANSASLLAGEGASQRKEVLIRRWLGASLRHLFVRRIRSVGLQVLLAVPLSVSLTKLGLARLGNLTRDVLPLWAQPRLGPEELAFLGCVGALSVLLLASLSATVAMRGTAAATLRATGDDDRSFGAIRLRNLLAALELAVATVLLVTGTLLLANLRVLTAVDTGFEPKGAVALEGNFSYRRGLTPSDWEQILGEVERVLADMPGVVAVGSTSDLPLAGQETWDRADLVSQHDVPRSVPAYPPVNLQAVDRGYFDALGLRLLEGRTFDEGDLSAGIRPVIVSRSLAVRRWPGRSAIGREVRLSSDGEDWREVVGVVENVRHHSLAREPGDDLYVPWTTPWKEMYLVVRTEGQIAPTVEALRRAASSVSSDFGVRRAFPLAELVGSSVWLPRIWSHLFAALSLLAVGLAAAGVYGVMAHLVSQRLSEISVRLALGATSRDVLFLVLGSASRLVAVGLTLGLVGSWATTRLVASQLSLIASPEPSTVGTAVGLLTLVGLAAAGVPAIRAQGVDPARVLRME